MRELPAVICSTLSATLAMLLVGCSDRVVLIESDPEIVVVDPNICAREVARGGLLVEPGGLTPAQAGGVWVANSTTLLSRAADHRPPGGVLHVDGHGRQTLYTSGSSLRGPDRVGVEPTTTGEERVVVSLEDQSEFGASTDRIVEVTSSGAAQTLVAQAYEPAGLMWLRQDVGALYFTSRSATDEEILPAPNPRRLFRHFVDRGVEQVPLHHAGREVTGLRALAVPTSSMFSGDFYVSTLEDDDAWDPNAHRGIYSVRFGGQAEPLLPNIAVYDMAFSLGGAFGEALYVVDGASQLLRVGPDGSHRIVVFGLDHPSGLAFSDDGLYVAEAGRPSVVRFESCGKTARGGGKGLPRVHTAGVISVTDQSSRR